MKIVAIVQARMSSTRFPGKVLADLCGKPMLSVLLHRLQMCKSIDEIAVATTENPADDILVEWLIAHGISCYRGSETDVLDRFMKCAEATNADVIVRVTADDPLKDPEIIERALAQIIQNPTVDYVSNTVHPTYPEGLDIEVFTRDALHKAALEAELSSEREHVTPFIWKHPEKFSILNFEMQPDLANWRWTVDKPEDLEFIRIILSHFGNDIEIGYSSIIELINNKPELMEINSGTMRNEGYIVSTSKEVKNG